MSNVVIKVEGLWKEYRLGVMNHQTLAHDLQSWWARCRGKEDPNSQLGSVSSLPHGSKKFWALRDVSFEVGQGEILGIVGRNGAGKSTLLKILSQVTSPTRGKVCFNGRIASLLEVGTGFHPELTGRENIFLNGAILGMSKADIRNRLDEIIAFAEVDNFIDTPVKRYSSGMYVRLAFAVAAHLEPEILIIDEVLAVGDAYFQRKCLGKMQDVGRSGRTVLFVSHNMGTIRQLCTSGLLLDNGGIVALGNIGNIIDTYLQSISISRRIEGNFIASNSLLGITLIDVDIINDKGVKTSALQTGMPGSIRLFMEAAQQIENLIVSIAVHTLGDIRVCILHTKISGNISIDLVSAQQYLVCQLPKVSFPPAVYQLHIKVARANGDIVFTVPYAKEITVESGDFFGTGRLPDADWSGAVLVDHTWHIQQMIE